MNLLVTMMCLSAAALPQWTFDRPGDLQGWEPNGFLTDVAVSEGSLTCKAIDWDPFFTLRGLEVAATPWQYVVLRMKATQSGGGELFWTSATEGKYGGFEEDKRTSFQVIGDGAWHDVVLFPFWHTEGVIRQLRLDLYDGAAFEIDSIAIRSWGDDRIPDTATVEWRFDGSAPPWPQLSAPAAQWSYPLRLDVADKGWVSVTMTAAKDGVATFLYASTARAGAQSEDFAVRGDGRPRTYNLELGALPAWTTVVAVGMSIPSDLGASVESLVIGAAPRGPAEVRVSYLGFENAVNRAGRANSVLLQLTNHGGEAARGLRVTLTPGDGFRLAHGEATQTVDPIAYDEQAHVTWQVTADRPGLHGVTVSLEGGAAAEDVVTASLGVMEPIAETQADYVPEPQPVATSHDVLAYYFPGWDSDAKWDCIRRVAPIRKPLLGYYDEGNPECVDWQIKWAVENGITGFLVDWYWVKGHQSLLQWFDAYRVARYRERLKVAIMWANHNPQGTHSIEDWRDVTREWIEKYFNLPGYYRIDRKPAVFLWDPNLIRHDLGGTAALAEAFQESQAMARAAGYEGITFVAMQAPRSAAQVKALREEGYSGLTSYHEWGKAGDLAPAPKDWRYEDLVATVPDAWAAAMTLAGELAYYPVVDTGWDARPWHGNKMQVIGGRTPARFERLLQQAKEFTGTDGRPIVILGPVNEWGEGSYIEPATEYDFAMYEAIRNVFATEPSDAWPMNVGPRDVGRGPYDFPPREPVTAWRFEETAQGWRAMMNTSEVRVENGALRFRSLSSDPALVVDTPDLMAEDFSKLEITMQLTGPVKPGRSGQVFWSRGGSATTEASSVSFPLVTDGAMHTYTIDLSANPRWRGRISALRFDPCADADLDVAVDSMVFKSE